MNAPIVRYQAALVPFGDLQKMAAAVAESGLFGMKDSKQALALMLTAQAEGQHPATITQDYDIIQGKATRKTHSVLARFQQAGGRVEWHALSDTKADATFTPPSGSGKPLRLGWTIEMARHAGLVEKDNWKRYPRAMLRSRLIAEGVRATYPAAIGGMLIAEEVQDMDSVPGEVTEKTVIVERPKAKPEEPPVPASNDQPTAETGDAPQGEAAPETEEGLTEGAKTTLRNALKRHGRTEADLVAAGFLGVDCLPFSRFNDAMAWLKKG